MSKNILYIRVLLVIICVAVIMAFVNRSPRHVASDAWLPSSFNPVGAGSMALYQTLEESSWPVQRWREPLSRLSAYPSGNVLVITRARASARVNFSDQEIDLLTAWVSKGNTLLLLGSLAEWDDTRLLLSRLGFILPHKIDEVVDLLQPFSHEAGTLVEAQPVNSGKGTLVLPKVAAIPGTFPPHTKILWQQGWPYLVEVPCGAGRVICGGSADLLGRTSLERGDNLAIVLGLLQPGGKMPDHIFFEESHHGYSAGYAAARLLGHPGIGFAGMLVLLGALTFFGSSLVRFGPVVPLHRESGRSTLEFVDSIAELYRRADLRNETMKYLFDETHQRILHRLNLPPTASHDLIAARLKLAHPRLASWKKLAQRFDSKEHQFVEGLPPTGWLRVARDLIEIKSAMA